MLEKRSQSRNRQIAQIRLAQSYDGGSAVRRTSISQVKSLKDDQTHLTENNITYYNRYGRLNNSYRRHSGNFGAS